MNERLAAAREAVRSTAVAMAAAGLVTGSSGNVSVRFDDRALITPSGVPYAELEANQVIEIDKDGKRLSGAGEPSTEWRMHVAIYARCGDVHAIVHTHSPVATAAAISLSTLPILHDEGKLLFGEALPVSAHRPPGTWDLAEAVVAALGDGRGCLIAKHGAVAVGATPAEALGTAIKIEEAARLYLLSRQLGAT